MRFVRDPFTVNDKGESVQKAEDLLVTLQEVFLQLSHSSLHYTFFTVPSFPI